MKKKTVAFKFLDFLQLAQMEDDITLPQKDMFEHVCRYVPVISTFPDRPESFWLRIVTAEEEEKYQEMMDRMNSLYNSFLMSEPSNDPEMDRIAEFEKELRVGYQNRTISMAKVVETKKKAFEEAGNLGVAFTDDNVFCRIFVKEWSSVNGVEVSLWDSGETLVIDPCKVLLMHSDLGKYPPFSFNCHLIGIRPSEDVWPDEALTFFRNELRQGTRWHMVLFPMERDSYHGQHPVLIGRSGYKPYILSKELIKFRMAMSTEIEEREEVWENFEPAEEHFRDDMNQFNVNWDDPGVRLFGYASKDDSVICPQFGRTGHCIKGDTCRKEHILIDKTKFSTLPQIIYFSSFKELDQLEYNVEYEPLWMMIAIGELHVVLMEDVEAHPGFHKFCETANKKEAIAKYQPMVVPPGVGEVVLINYKSEWERAQCIESEQNSDTYKCLLVDAGGEVTCTLPQMRQIPSWCLQLPFFMRRVKLHNFKANSDAQLDVSSVLTGKFKLRLVGRGGESDLVSVVSSNGIDLSNYLHTWEVGQRIEVQIPVGDYLPG